MCFFTFQSVCWRDLIRLPSSENMGKEVSDLLFNLVFIDKNSDKRIFSFSFFASDDSAVLVFKQFNRYFFTFKMKCLVS